MKALVFADSHGYSENIKRIIKSYSNTVNYIIHLGDLVHDAKKIQQEFESDSLKVIYVCGNCDFSTGRTEYEKEFEICGRRFLILHGHTRNVKYSIDSLKTLANLRQCDIILYGHTHVAKEDYYNGSYIINPGSISKPRDGRRGSYAIIDISNGKINIDIRRDSE